MSIRTAVRAAFIASSFLAGCSSPVQPPSGQTYTTVTKAYDGDLKGYASQATIDTVLSNPGTTLVDSVVYPDCPGLGGLQTYKQTKAGVKRTILIGYTVREGKVTTAIYGRDASAPPDAAIMKSMTSTICHL